VISSWFEEQVFRQRDPMIALAVLFLGRWNPSHAHPEHPTNLRNLWIG